MLSKFLNYKKNFSILIVFLTGIFFSIITLSEPKITDDERLFMPRWCNHVQGFESDPRTIQFINQIGRENWLHLHHYCYGLVQMFRSHRTGLTLQQRQHHLGQAIAEINYVLKNASPRFAWRPELFTKRGEAFLLKQQYREAEDSFESAIKENASYWPPYGYLSDIYVKQGRIDKARETLQKGLKISPDAKGLKNRLLSLEKSYNN